MKGYRDDELVVRWEQFGAFSPILPLHSANNPWSSKEPWRYRPESEAATRDFMQLCHRLVPYIYSTNATSNTRLGSANVLELSITRCGI